MELKLLGVCAQPRLRLQGLSERTLHGAPLSETLVLDVSCPLDNGLDTFTETRRHKSSKYRPVRDHLQRRYQRDTVEAIVISALCSSVPASDAVMRRLCNRCYLRTLKRLVVSGVVVASARSTTYTCPGTLRRPQRADVTRMTRTRLLCGIIQRSVNPALLP
ncbi:hypothetical protein HPB50_015349 [Hyalomma asiaticum]|uniref:Uncharacterized protein n=1 Tax=Hyalomma asiaticum TaxID=266040 RepID=A0ACB7SYS3_HYAAI|nr:hypothetical protein HPB50_015349 [Hyalomma asiaticum]